MDLLLRNRMHERDGAGMQTDAAIGIGTFGSIFQIAFDGATNFCQLATNLMMTAGLEINFKQKIFLRSCYQLVMKNRFFGIRLFRIIGCRFVGFFVFYHLGQSSQIHSKAGELRPYLCCSINPVDRLGLVALIHRSADGRLVIASRRRSHTGWP